MSFRRLIVLLAFVLILIAPIGAKAQSQCSSPNYYNSLFHPGCLSYTDLNAAFASPPPFGISTPNAGYFSSLNAALASFNSLALPPSSAAGASFLLAPGAAPTNPINGQIWTTSVGLYAYINGAVQGPYGTGGGGGTTPSGATNALQLNAGGGSFGAVSGVGASTQALIGTGAAPVWGQINAATMITGNLPVANLGGGTSASASTFWNGTGAWTAVPASSLSGSTLPSAVSNALFTLFTGQANTFASGNLQTINTSRASPRLVTGNTTLLASDAGNGVQVNSSSPATVTTIASMPLGSNIEIEQLGTGQVSIANGTNATQTSSNGWTATRTQNSIIRLHVDATSGTPTANYNITGDGAVGGGGSGASVVSCSANTPSQGLLVTGSTVNISCLMSAPITVSGTPTIALNTSPSAVVNFGSVTGGNTLVFPYTVASGQNTPNTNNQPYLATISSAAIVLAGGSTITAGGVNATLTGANNQIFASLEVNTSPTYFVAKTGNDSNAGSFASPFLTMQKCQTAMAGGATKQCYVLAGTYTGSTCSVSVIGFTDTAYICPTGSDNAEFWSGYPGQTAIMDGGSTSSSTGVALAWGMNGVTGFNINAFTMQNFRHGGVDAVAVSGLTFSNNTCNNLYSVQTSQGCAFFHYQMANIVLNNNNCTGFLGSFCLGMGTGDSDPGMSGYFTIQYNSAASTNRTTSDSGCYYLDDASHTNRNGTVSYNTCNNPGASSSASICLYLDDDSSFFNLISNRCSGTHEYALLFHGGDHNVVQYNVFDISNALKVALYQDNPSHDVGGGGMAGNQFINNIVYSTASPPTNLWDYIDSSLTIANPSLTNNLYYDSASPFTNYGDGSHFTDSNPTVGNPLFVNPSVFNYQVQAASPALVTPVSMPQLPSFNPGIVGPHTANDNERLDELEFRIIIRAT